MYKTYAHANVHSPDFAHFDKSRVRYVQKNLQHIFDHHKTDWGFAINDNWNRQNRRKLIKTLTEFVHRNADEINVYIGTYRNENAYLVVDPISYQCLIVYRGGERDYSIWSGWILSKKQYRYVTSPPYSLKATVLLVYEDILEQIANSEGERDDLIKRYLKIYLRDENWYDEEVYDTNADFFYLAESYVPLSFEGREEMTHNYELDFEKVREKARTLLAELEKVTH